MNIKARIIFVVGLLLLIVMTATLFYVVYSESDGSPAEAANIACQPYGGVLEWRNEGSGYFTATCKSGRAVDGR